MNYLLHLFISSERANLPLFVLFLISCNTTFTSGQYETQNNLCGGWFKSVNASIKFNYNETATMDNQVCAWTVSGSLSEYGRYDIKIQQTPGLICNPSTTKIAISHFNLYDRDVTATETWNCGSPQEWKAVPGTVFIVVFKTDQLIKGTGFQLEWAPSGDILNHGGIRSTNYSWGKPSIAPLPYYASAFFTNEVATYVFPRGNNTNILYKLEIDFENIRLDQCGGPFLGDCEGATNSSLLLLTIEDDARLKLGKLYTQTETFDGTEKRSSTWGMVILVWVGNFWGAGGNFQMIYDSVR